MTVCACESECPGLSVSMCAYEMRLSACETLQPIQRERGSTVNGSSNGTQTFM